MIGLQLTNVSAFSVTPAEFARRDVDPHVHTHTSACGYTSHRQLIELARLSGRKIIAVTDHDSAAGALSVRDLASRMNADLTVLVGMELTTRDFGHVVLFGNGVEEDWGWRKNDPFPLDIPDHWLAIQAHPYRARVTIDERGTTVDTLPDPPRRIDAVEVWNAGDVLKKTPGLRRELDRLSWDYVRAFEKTPVASSDGHRPLWVHSFFSRFDRPIYTVDDLVSQVRAQEVTPMVRDEAHLDVCRARWHRRAVVEWREAQLDWRKMADAAGYAHDEAQTLLERYDAVRTLSSRGATLSQMVGETGMTGEDVLDYVSMIEEQVGNISNRQLELAGRIPAASSTSSSRAH
jgi:hypothetical protein